MTTQFRDFDDAWAEAAKDAPGFRAFGRDYILPTSPPIKVTLMAMRSHEDGSASQTMNPEQILDVAGMLIGRSQVQSLLDEGATFEQLSDLIRWAMDVYNSRRGEGEPDPEAPGAGGSPEPSSPTGGHSKPTGSESTGWI